MTGHASRSAVAMDGHTGIMAAGARRRLTVAKATGRDVLESLRQAVDASIADGQPFSEFKARVRDVLASLGWWGVQRQTNPKTGEDLDLCARPARVAALQPSALKGLRVCF